MPQRCAAGDYPAPAALQARHPRTLAHLESAQTFRLLLVRLHARDVRSSRSALAEGDQLIVRVAVALDGASSVPSERFCAQPATGRDCTRFERTNGG